MRCSEIDMANSKIDQRIIDLWDTYVHVHFDRRVFLKEAAALLGSATAAAALVPALASNYARAAVVAENDPRIAVERLSFPGATGDLKAYLAKPKGTTGPKQAGILVVHQNRGLNPHIEDIARRLASDGYVALAVDFLSPLGGTPPVEDAAMRLFPQLDLTKVTADAHAGVAYLRARGESNGKIGAVGFCWGGGIVNRIAADPLAKSDANITAGVVYYGALPPLEDVPKIKVPLLLNYADPKLDARLGALLPDYEQALKAAHVSYQLYTYEGANHAFNDDTQTARYDEAAAKLAWSRTLAFFKDDLA
jgi:carboxymethylenebutenolidase